MGLHKHAITTLRLRCRCRSGRRSLSTCCTQHAWIAASKLCHGIRVKIYSACISVLNVSLVICPNASASVDAVCITLSAYSSSSWVDNSKSFVLQRGTYNMANGQGTAAGAQDPLHLAQHAAPRARGAHEQRSHLWQPEHDAAGASPPPAHLFSPGASRALYLLAHKAPVLFVLEMGSAHGGAHARRCRLATAEVRRQRVNCKATTSAQWPVPRHCLRRRGELCLC